MGVTRTLYRALRDDERHSVEVSGFAHFPTTPGPTSLAVSDERYAASLTAALRRRLGGAHLVRFEVDEEWFDRAKRPIVGADAVTGPWMIAEQSELAAHIVGPIAILTS